MNVSSRSQEINMSFDVGSDHGVYSSNELILIALPFSCEARALSSLPRLQGGCDQLGLRKAGGCGRGDYPQAEVRADR
ncbi:unnamed protein product [Pieris brassicae]|uniref:Uncharacterized protein n=1 Tax=Pieris brassicae TaxID=7116 RepID=A0A9P0T4C0_PIEBR|nr:unnamed protein product [Pieris brassicae]